VIVAVTQWLHALVKRMWPFSSERHATNRHAMHTIEVPAAATLSLDFDEEATIPAMPLHRLHAHHIMVPHHATLSLDEVKPVHHKARERENVHAHTQREYKNYPGFISLNLEADESITLMVRSPEHGGEQMGMITLAPYELEQFAWDAITFLFNHEELF
jgi:hypothetical protein